jgi:hypothetical protein
LKSLGLSHGKFADLTPLREMPLTSFYIFQGRDTPDLSPLREISTLETIGRKPVAQFWKEYDAKKAEGTLR